MGNTLVSTLSAITIVLSTIISPTPSASLPNTSKIEAPRESFITYVIKPGDSMGSIANTEFGSEDYWTTIWNDNKEISNPNLIEKDQKLKIRTNKPDTVQDLLPDLKKQQEELKVIPQEVASSTPSPVQVSGSSLPGVLSEAQINFLGSCESGMTASRNSGNGYYGAFQFSSGTWNSMGTGYDRADLAPIDVQKDAVQRLVARSSISGQFPGCSAQMRAQGLL